MWVFGAINITCSNQSWLTLIENFYYVIDQIVNHLRLLVEKQMFSSSFNVGHNSIFPLNYMHARQKIRRLYVRTGQALPGFALHKKAPDSTGRCDFNSGISVVSQNPTVSNGEPKSEKKREKSEKKRKKKSEIDSKGGGVVRRDTQT